MDEFDWDDLRLFLAVARSGGLAAAAASTGKSAPTLGRRMLGLERRLGQELFLRLPRGYALTADGQALLARAAVLEARVQPILDGGRASGGPVVKVSAGTWVTHLLCAQVGALVRAEPVRLRFIAADEVVDIARREALIGIRNRRPEGVGLAGRRVARVHFAVYARDEGVRPWARVIGATPSARWVDAEAQGTPAIEVTSPRNALDLALAGAARLVLPSFVGKRFAALRQISPPIDALEHEQWLVTHHEERFDPAVRRVIDRVYGVLKAAAD